MPDAGRDTTCGAQTYWYESGVQRATFCRLPATRVTQALDGSRNDACDQHAAMAVEAGARDVTPPAEPVVPEWAVEKAAAAIHANECSHEHHVFACPSARMFERAATLALDAVLPHFALREESPHA